MDGKCRIFKAWYLDVPAMPMHLMWLRILPAEFDQARYKRAQDDGFRMYWLCEAHGDWRVMEDEASAVLTAAHMNGYARCQYQHSYIHSTYGHTCRAEFTVDMATKIQTSTATRSKRKVCCAGLRLVYPQQA